MGLPELALPSGLCSRYISTSTGLRVHYIEAFNNNPSDKIVILLHGFPELAYSWRNIIPRLNDAGYRAIAPDQRGFGRTEGGSMSYDADLDEFSMDSLAGDIVAFIEALGLQSVEAIVGHDFGSPVAASCALSRPELFKRVVIISSPHSFSPKVAFTDLPLHKELASLSPPLKHYQSYYTTEAADFDMHGKFLLDNDEKSFRDFLRAYFHIKSADWYGNHTNLPRPLPDSSAQSMAKLPIYYVMPFEKTMPETVLSCLPASEPSWLPDSNLDVYISEFKRTGFQGGLNWYRRRAINCSGLTLNKLGSFQIPAAYIAGKYDWGTYQSPKAIDTLRNDFGVSHIHIIDDSGHWVQQEQPEELASILLKFLQET